MEIQGFVKPGFEGVRDAFSANFDEGLEDGACVTVTKDGEFVVDLWAGEAHPDGRPWERDTIINVYSTTKTMAALCVLMLADRGEVDLAAPVATYWPEFATNGKEAITISHVMSHSAGLSGFDPPPENVAFFYEWDACVERLAAQAPWWAPGTQSGYHAITQGYLQGEIVRRVTGRSIGSFFREEVAEPLGADFHIGLPASEDARVAQLVPPPNALGGGGDERPPKDSVAARTFAGAPLTATEPRTREWRAAEIPAAGGTGNARSVGRVHSALACGGAVDGVRLLSEAGVERILEEQVSGKDLVLGVPFSLGNGFGINSAKRPLGPNPRTFFWGGWGGSLAMTDLDARMTISYVMNRMAASLVGDLRGGKIAASAYASLAQSGATG